ncbi:MAG: ArnT family glycosyltransferase, partial [Desulfomonilaceae bacterium]
MVSLAELEPIATISNRKKMLTAGSADKEKWAILLAFACIFLWHANLTVNLNLIPDECSYWTWSRHLDWSYFDNSGMTAYLIRLSTEIFGRSTPFTVRFPFFVAGVITTILIYSSAALLSGSTRIGAYSALFFNLVPLSLLGAGAAVHDNALIMFWALALWSLVKFTKTDNYNYFYLTGLATGFAILSKYTGVLLLPSVLLWLIFSSRRRSVLARKEPWIGALLAALFTLPIVWWNYLHGWASFKHVLFIGSSEYRQLWRKISDGIGYQLAQCLTISPLFYFALVMAIFSSIISKGRKYKDEKLLLLFMGVPLVIFSVMAFKGHSEANWAVMGYLSTGILTVMVLSDPDDRATKFLSQRWG